MKLTETILGDLDFNEECWFKGRYKGGQTDFPDDPHLRPGYIEVVLAGYNMEIIDAEKAVVVEKVKIPQCVADWVEQKKSKGDLEELLDISTYCDDEKVLDWYDNFANDDLVDEILAKAYLVGYVVEEPPMGVLLVEVPEKTASRYYYLESKSIDWFMISKTDSPVIVGSYAHKVTEAVAKEKYPNFKWMSLEELENEG